ncbi:MAG: substrate-binding domain-containing protein, partial [Cyanobacteriota bacterium]|nr:substrate-binding domain-containing protein [Cyanobacteriota bacterium]
MSSSSKNLFQISVVLLTLTATPKSLAAATNISFLSNTILAESVNSDTTYQIPESLPSGTKIRLYGSNSMTVINRLLKQRYEEKYPDAQVELAAGDTSEVLEALRKGETDIAAIGRPLTAEEKDQGLVQVPIERGKIAVIVGPENPFLENLSFDQFAQILRGEVTNWSEIGGPQVPIRFIDRPEFSDTREALKSYDVFKTAPFQTGGNATRVSLDDTAAVIQELGKNGISYAIADQVLNKEDVRVIQMHKTLPNDPRYPYSQPRNYIYNKDAAPPEVLAFMGLVTSPVGQEVVATVAQEGETDSAISPGVATTTNSDTAPEAATNQSIPDTQTETAANSSEVDSGETDSAISAGVATTTNSDTASETATNQSSPDTQTETAEDSSEVDSAVPGAVVTSPSPNTSTVNEANSSEVVGSPSPTQSDTALLPNDTSQETETEGFPWWLIFLLGIPLLGALIWGLQRGRGDDSAQTDTEIETVTPVDGGDITGRARPEAGVDTTTSETRTTTVDGNETTPTDGIGIAPIAGGLGVAGLLAAWANREKNSQIVLIRQSAQSGLTTWFVPEEDQ